MFSVWCRMKQLACLMTAKYTLLLKGKDNFILYALLYTYTFYKHRIIIFILIALFSRFFVLVCFTFGWNISCFFLKTTDTLKVTLSGVKHKYQN